MKKIFRMLLVVCDVISILAMLYFILWLFWNILKDFSVQFFLLGMMGIAFVSLMLLIPSIALLSALRKPTYDNDENPLLTVIFGIIFPSFMLILIPVTLLEDALGEDLAGLLMLILLFAGWMFFFFVAMDWFDEKRRRSQEDWLEEKRRRSQETNDREEAEEHC